VVYVLSIDNKPLMPCAKAKARKLLKGKKAKIVKYEPFTIKLTFKCENKTQDIILGVDAGSKVIGLSATTDKKELISIELELRNDIVDLLSTRRQSRRTRRNRLRYRKSRFLNRSKPKGWLAPSIQHKINTHLDIVNNIHQFLPITKIIVETASFDIQKIKNPNISGKEYQEGNQLDFWNVREYVLFRDSHKCQGKKGCKEKILNVHHIESRKIGGDSPSNLITLCESCHSDYHKGKLNKEFKRGKSFRYSAFMGVMRWAFYNKLKELYSNVNMTFGYITKNTRIINNLSKEHRIDALCITRNIVERCKEYFYIKKTRCHNRQIHKANILKGGKKKSNQASYLVKGFRLFDKVEYLKEKYFIFGRRNSGFFDIRKLDGTKVNKGSISYKKLNFIETRRTDLLERRMQGVAL